MPYDPTIYLGSAAHYRYGRPAYSPELEAVLTHEAGLDRDRPPRCLSWLDINCLDQLNYLHGEGYEYKDVERALLASGCTWKQGKGDHIKW